jgi:MFS family permease
LALGDSQKHHGSTPDPERGYGAWTAVLRGVWASRPGSLPRGNRHRYRLALVALLIGDVTFAFQQTAVIPTLPSIEQDLQAPATWSAWLLSGYLIVATIATPLLGKLGDQRGKRRLLLAALVLFLVGSVGAAVSPNIGVLIAFRTAQGAGGAVFPLSFSVVRDEFPDERVGLAIGVLTGGFGAGSALGLGLGGVIAEALSWRFIFVVGGVAILVSAALVALLVPPSPVTTESRLDVLGGALFGGALAALLLALTEGVRLGWGSWPIVVLFVASAGLLAGWIGYELRAESPLIDLRVLGAPAVLLTNLATLALGYLIFGVFFLVPHLVEAPAHAPVSVVGQLHYGFAASAAEAGLYLVPAAIGQLIGGPLSGVIERRWSPKWPFVAGMALGAAGAAGLAGWHDRPWQVVIGMLVLGTGVGFGIGAGGTLVTQAVSEQDTGISNAVNTALRRMGGGIGGQIGAALLATLTVAGTQVPRESAFVFAFAIAAVLCLIGAGCALFVPPKT